MPVCVKISSWVRMAVIIADAHISEGSMVYMALLAGNSLVSNLQACDWARFYTPAIYFCGSIY